MTGGQLLLGMLLCSVVGGSARLPPFSWDHIPTYAFCSPITHEWNATELRWLKGEMGFPGPLWIALGYDTEYKMDPYHQKCEMKQTRAALQLKREIPELTVLAGTAWDLVFHDLFDVDLYFNTHPDLLLRCNGTLQLTPSGYYVHDWGNPAARATWAGLFANYSLSGGFDGVLIDGIGPDRPPYNPEKSGYDIWSNPNCTQAERQRWSDGQALAIREVREAIGKENLTMCNGHLQLFASPGPPHAVQWCNGNWQEEWQGTADDVLLLLEAGKTPNYPVGVRSVGDNNASKASPQPGLAAFNVSLAAFLVASTDRHYFLHFLTYGCGDYPGPQMQFYPEYTKPLGPPGPRVGSCEHNGECVLYRNFSAGVRVFYNGTTLKKEMGCIRWSDGTTTDGGGGCSYFL